MWPVLLNMTRDECRRTLRRLELEAYSNMISVFRAQGALEDNRKKLLEELRAVLHISHDRHSAEARRVSNDELLATIAEHIAGPNTALAWISEGRRIIPLMPRGIAQTMYTEIADKVAEISAAENKELQIVENKLITPVSNVELPDPEIAESALECSESMDEAYPHVATEDHSSKIWETEIICRKRKISEGAVFEGSMTPIKNMKNIPANSHQKHLNLSQVYSKYSQPTTSKSLSQSKHSYNQVSKVSSKPCQTRMPRQQKPKAHKPRTPRQKKQPKEVQSTSEKQFNPASLQIEYSGPPNSFQASYAQSILSNKNRDFMDEFKPKVKSSPGMVSDSPTIHSITQPATVPHELGLSENAHPDDPKSLQAQSTPIAKSSLTKASQIVLKSRESEKKMPVPEFKIVQKPNDNIKILTNRQVVVAPNSTQKTLNARALVTTKVLGSISPGRPSPTPVKSVSDKVVVVSKAPIDTRISHPKFVITSSATTASKKTSTSISSNAYSPSAEPLTPKGIPATDLKVSAKTFVLNPKSGKKMFVLPAKTSKEGQAPLFHFKGVPTAMKVVSVSSQPNTIPTPKFNLGGTTSKPTVVSVAGNPKVVSAEPIKTANLADIVPVKGLTPVPQKITNPSFRPVSSKGNVIVVQKGASLGKTLTLTKNGNDHMSKIIMGKNVNRLLQAKSEQGELSKSSNVIVLELNNEQTGKATTMSEILGNHAHKTIQEEVKASHVITQDTPVLFDTHPATEINMSLDSTASVETTDADQREIGAKGPPGAAEWEMELESAPAGQKQDKLNSMHVDLGMSSESESEYINESKSRSEHSSHDRIQHETQRGPIGESYSGGSGSLATKTLLSQLRDDGSSSNDSSFAVKSKIDAPSSRLDKSESEALSKAKAKLTQKVAEAQSQQKRIDVYSTAISTADIHLDSFSYLDDNLMADDDFAEAKREPRRNLLDQQLSRFLGEDSADSADSQPIERLPLTNE